MDRIPLECLKGREKGAGADCPQIARALPEGVKISDCTKMSERRAGELVG